MGSLRVAAASVALATAACGGGTAPSSDDGSEPAAVTTSVAVELFEYEVAPDTAGVPAGTVSFQVRNTGAEQHSFSVIKTSLGPAELPTLPEGNVDITSSELEVLTSTAQLGGGAAETVEVALATGSYVLVCNIVDHYSRGMRTGFRVS